MRNIAIGVAIILALVIAAYVLADREAVPSPTPSPRPTGTHSCAPRGTCRNGESCPAGTGCSGLPAYGCYPDGCPAPICLAADTLIGTPDGDVPVTQLAAGMLVWSVDAQGQKVAVPILKTGAAAVGDHHRVLHLTLEDGRELRVSPGHPTADGRFSDDLQPGDAWDDSRVLSAALVPYEDGHTYDLLPTSETGFYWANGILMGSTLK